MHPTVSGSGRLMLGFQYFLHFSVMGIVLPYFNLYCFHIGLTGFEIGALSALRSATLVLFSLVWSTLADRYSARKPIYILCIFTSTGIWSLYLFTVDFWMILAITLIYGIFYSSIISFLEAFTMDALGVEKTRYGSIRAWGSVSFIAVVILIGKIIDLYRIDVILVLVLLGTFLQSMASFKIPEVKRSRKHQPFLFPTTLFRKEVIVFLGCAFLMLASHGAYYAFFSIHLESLGYTKTFIGFAWALASLTEIGVMIRSKAIFENYSLHTVLVFSFLVAALRWGCLIFFRSAFTILLSQCLHSITYGAFHMTSILYMDTLAPDEAKTVGQAANNAVTYGLGLMAGFFIAGALYEPIGAKGLFAISGIIALLAGAIFQTTGKRIKVFPP